MCSVGVILEKVPREPNGIPTHFMLSPGILWNTLKIPGVEGKYWKSNLIINLLRLHIIGQVLLFY